VASFVVLLEAGLGFAYREHYRVLLVAKPASS
jgi:hypothetical protein